MSIKITIKDEVNTVFSGLPTNIIKKLHERFGPFVPGYMHTPKYKLGVWDGKIRFFRETGATYTYLIEDILEAIMEYGGHNLPIEIADKRERTTVEIPLVTEDIFAHIMHPKSGKPIILRDYQVGLANTLIEHRNGIGRAATGAGKTLITAALSTVFGQAGIRTLTIVPDVGLVKQTVADYKLVGLSVGEVSGDKKEIHKMHVVTTWQSLQNIPHIIRDFGMVMVDEAHKAKSTVLNNILTKNAAHIEYRFGVTGTLPEEDVDKLTVHCALGPVRYVITAADLIERGVLAAPDIQVWKLNEDFKALYAKYLEEFTNLNLPAVTKMSYAVFKKKYFADFATEKTYLMTKAARIQFIADSIKYFLETRGNIMILVPGIKMARALGKLIPGSYVVNGVDVKDAKKRQAIYDRFEVEDGICAICTVHIASTGISINRIYTFMYIDIGKSFTRVIQSIGRALRTASDKQTVLVVDVCSDLHYSEEHLKKRVKFYKQESYPYTIQAIEYVNV